MGRIQQLPPAIKDRLDELLPTSCSEQSASRRSRGAILDRLGRSPARGGRRAAARALRPSTVTPPAWSRSVSASGRRARWRPSGPPSSERRRRATWALHTLEILRTLIYDLTLKTAHDDGDLDVEQLREIALTLQRIERASKLNADRERSLRKELAELAAAEAEKAAKAVAEQSGHALPAEALRTIREQVYGIVDA